jgi:hypothetical protein
MDRDAAPQRSRMPEHDFRRGCRAGPLHQRSRWNARIDRGTITRGCPDRRHDAHRHSTTSSSRTATR